MWTGAIIVAIVGIAVVAYLKRDKIAEILKKIKV